MVSRPTVADVAREAGVSVATVDRVINARLPVREDTTRRVLEAAQKLGFHATGLIRARLREQLPEYSVGLLLQRPDDPFYRDLAERLERAITGSRLFRGLARLRLLDRRRPRRHRRAAAPARAALRRRWRWSAPTIAAVAEAIAELTARGVPVFALLSDCASAARTCYLGIDSRKAGRTAGWLVRQCAAPARQGGGDRRQPPLPGPRAARDRLPLLLPRAGARSSSCSTRW